MFQDNRLSTTPLGDLFVSPYDKVDMYNSLVDWQRGGLDIQDSSSGLDVQNWTIYEEDGSIYIATEDGSKKYLQQTLENLELLSLAFDQNMNPAYVYKVTGDTPKFYWFDTTANDFVTTDLGDVEYPRVCTDDTRDSQTSNSDIILAYTKSGSLFCKLQRDRYETEYTLSTSWPYRLYNMGMGVGYRVQFAGLPV